MKKKTNVKSRIAFILVENEPEMPLDFLDYLTKFVTLSAEERTMLANSMQVITCFPHQVLTNVGELEQHIYFVQKGMVRKFFYHEQNEVTVYLADEGQMISASVSFLTGVVSEFVIETIEPCTLWFVTRSALENLYSYSVNFERLGLMITLDSLLLKEKIDILRMTASPQERFLFVYKEMPDLLARAPQKYVASMLNMKPETFSRFKKKLMEEMKNE
ncbi:MAG: cyclic nucleotide-binding domain-containing protein [Bacteroidetes bacterium]|nr:cyclic nucleotide-binding domain-containing protein [Bacteroidota bacterium]